jgi:hypothetical protein
VHLNSGVSSHKYIQCQIWLVRFVKDEVAIDNDKEFIENLIVWEEKCDDREDLVKCFSDWITSVKPRVLECMEEWVYGLLSRFTLIRLRRISLATFAAFGGAHNYELSRVRPFRASRGLISKVYLDWPVVGWGFVLFWVSFMRCPLVRTILSLLHPTTC